MFIAVDRLGIDVQQGSYFKHDRFATRRAAVDLFSLHAHRLSVRAAAGSHTARTGSGVKVHQFFNHRIVLHRKPAGGVTQNDAKDESQHADGRDGNPDSTHYNFTRPLKPIKARDIKPAVTRAMALPRNGAGISAAARRSRIEANRTITKKNRPRRKNHTAPIAGNYAQG